MCRVGVLVALALAVAGCGGDKDPQPKPEPTPGMLVVREQLPQGPVFIEGSIPLLRLITGDGDDVFNKPAPIKTLDKPLLRRRLPAGRYELRTAQLPCNANCGNLGEAVLACDADLEVPPGGRVVAMIVLTSDPLACRLEIT